MATVGGPVGGDWETLEELGGGSRGCVLRVGLRWECMGPSAGKALSKLSKHNSDQSGSGEMVT